MSDSFSEVSSEGWLSRIGNSIKGIFFGGIAIIVSVVLLFWNEGRAVQTAKSLDEGAGTVVSASADKVDSANNNKLVHITGEATTDEVLRDDEFKVEQAAIRLERLVEMYQWEEETEKKSRKKLGGGKETVTTYTYKEVWSSHLIDSSDFNEKGRAEHQNPSAMKVESQSWNAGNVTVGAYTLSSGLRDRIDNPSDVEVSQDNVPEVYAEDMEVQGNDTLYLGTSPTSPKIGDCRIKFVSTLPAEVSVVAEQTGDTFQPYQTEAGDALSMLRMGSVSADQMFEMAQADNTQLTWILRGAGVVIMFVGFTMIMSLFSVLADVIPFLGSLVEVGVALFSGLLTISGSSMVIGFAWLFYRPLIGVPLLVLSVSAVVLLIAKRPKRA